jgi:cellulose synthase/poly-beta-1,6-N-acetylglucosamine synthase-like glycosyltransferase
MPDASLVRFAEAAFWIALGLVAYVYVGYPVTLSLLRPRSEKKGPARKPSVTIVIAAHNEADQIEATVVNKLSQEYPPDRLDLVVVSDGSTDDTDAIVARYLGPRVTLLRQEPRQGKTSALNRALCSARGEIIVFADANSQYEPRAVAALVDAFGEPTVGYVTGCLRYIDPGDTAVGAGSGMYMRYENWIRRLETRVGSVIGVNGGIDAIRKHLYTRMDASDLPDFVLPLRVVQRGYRVVFCEDAHAAEVALGRQHDEFKMRVRVSLRALHALYDLRHLLHPMYGLFSFQLWVHKVLRYAVIVPLAAALLINFALVSRPLYAVLLGVQGVVYGLAIIGWLSGGRIRLRPVFVPFYFCLINAAAAAALLRFLRGERQVLWNPRKGA